MADTSETETIEALKAQVEALKRQLAKTRPKAAVEFLGENIPADLAAGGKLSALAVKSRPDGMHGDGGNLWLQVTPGGRSWVFRYRWRGKGREMGLGSVHDIGIGEARGRAAICRRLVREGIDPIERRRQATAAEAAEVRRISFRKAAERYIGAHKATWKNDKHAAQWPASLEAYAYPVIGDLNVQDVDTDQVLKILEPIWPTKPETAARVRGRIEAVLDWASARRMRHGENPARWKGHMQKLLPAKTKVRAVKHHAALPFAEMNAFWRALEGKEGASVEALRFVILTAARTGEVIGATWGEVDLGEKVWTIPGSRMKAGKEHRIPLSDEAVALLKRLRPENTDPAPGVYIFPGGKADKPLSNMAMLMMLRKAGRAELTAHGFRSSFSDWAAERTVYPSEMVEMALAHTIGSKVEAAYRRGDMFDRRRRLMADWATYCLTTPPARADNVRSIGDAR